MLKWCYKNPLLFSVYYFIFYLLFFFTLERQVTSPVWLVSSQLDALIPFSKYAVIPYCLWFPWIAITILGMMKWGSRKEYIRTCSTMYLGMTLCLIFYCIVPNGLAIRPSSVEGTDLCALIVRWLYSFDSPMNVCPSLHVYVSVCMDLGWQNSSILKGPKYRWIKIMLRLLDISICAATVMLKQHSIIDVISGLILAVVMTLLMNHVFKPLPEADELQSF
ncbi:MAG: hypothetical protein EOM64_00710 [Erysipelotrichia bacterium]|nr:hypothetical protein [Erysipelotrichia bacterium]